MKTSWTGFIYRNDNGGISGYLTDKFGMKTELTGVVAEVDGVKGYALTARLAEVPASLALPGDEEDGIAIIE